MLDKHLVFKTSPSAEKNNFIFFLNYRISILQKRLFRIEKNESKNFLDLATQKVFYRNMEKQDFKYQIKNNELIIVTEFVELHLFDDLKISFVKFNNGKKVYILSNKGNLKGTSRTLDNYDGDINIVDRSKLELEEGVCSTSGVSVIDDSSSLVLQDDGLVRKREEKEIDIYLFCYEDNYLEAVQALYAICGYPPLLPRYCLGNWWSRFHAYSDKEYLSLMNIFKEKNIPFSIATVDMDWHYSFSLVEDKKINELNRTNEDYYGKVSGWTGYSWNKKLFPNYKDFLNKLHKKGLKVTLNLHPSDGIRWFEDCYEKMALALGKDPSSNQVIPFDITDTNFINNYFKIIHKPYEKDGVDFWWIDWQQGSSSSIEGLDPLWSLNHYHYLDITKDDYEGIILSRYSGVGSHRYPIGFSGDTVISWKSLDYLVYFTITSTNIGYTWWSHDIGGHMLGVKDDELFVRYIQFGVFSPINRLHSSASPIISKEPWMYQNGIEYIIEEFLRLRHKLIPYLYSSNYLNHFKGIPLIQPLYYKVKNKLAYKYKNEYYFGENLLVLPISKKSNNNFSIIKMFVPKGRWVDFFNNNIYEIKNEFEEVEMVRDLTSIPVLVKEGSIIPLACYENNETSNPLKLDIYVYPGNGEYTMYEKENDDFCQTNFSLKNDEDDNLILSINCQGNLLCTKQNRIMTIYFKTIEKGKIEVYENNLPIDCEYLSSCLAVNFIFNPNNKYIIRIKRQKENRIDYLKKHVQKVLTYYQEDSLVKEKIYYSLMKIDEINLLKEAIEQEKMPKEIKKMILEVF